MKKLGFIVAFICLSLGVSAQNQSQFTGSLLWKISGKDLKKPSYILGTHHAVSGAYTDSISGLNEALKQVKQVVGEIDMSNMDAIVQVAVKYSAMPTGYSYESLLSASDYSLLDKALSERIGVGLDQFKGLHPAAINALFIQLFCTEVFPEFQQPNFEPIDSYIQKTAKEQKKGIMGLETVEEQFELLYNSEPIDVQMKNLICLVKYPEESIEVLVQLTDLYYQKQLDKLYDMIGDEMKNADPVDDCTPSQSFVDGLNKQRNDKWLKILPEIMKKKTSLIAVGALHISGEDGLLYQLHKMGYTVEAVR